MADEKKKADLEELKELKAKGEDELNCADKKCREETLEICKEFKQSKDSLIGILNEVQVKYGYIPKHSQLVIAEYLNLPLAEIYGVITFYSRFTLIPKGKYNISICLGTACFVKGSKALLDRAKEKLNIEEGQTSEDGKFSLDSVRCIGACGLAPVFTVNGEVYGRATVKKMDEVLDDLIKNG